jgi:hypothetical protein
MDNAQNTVFYCWEGVFTVSLNSSGSYSIVICLFVAAGICSPSSCLAMDMYPDFTIPTFGRHVTILFISAIFFSAANTTFMTKWEFFYLYFRGKCQYRDWIGASRP